jgi:pSer/pThr/pTyr-binding forkhead associated (FHA) protein
MNVKMKVVQGKPNGSLLDFPEGEFVVGRGPECHVRPNSELISRQHCLLRIHGRDVRVRDLGSTNGTLVNGKLLHEECILANGDTLQLGTLVLELVLPHEEAALRIDEEVCSSDTIDTEFHRTIETDPPSDVRVPPKG